MRIRLVQQMSGTRGDGQPWPPPGVAFDVSAAEGMELCHTAAGVSPPIAVPVVEERKVETATVPVDPKVEIRHETHAVAEPTVSSPPRPASAIPDNPPPEKRGPGRPPKNGR